VEWGCEGNAILPTFMDGENQYTCLRRPIYDNPYLYNYVFGQYQHYLKGFLPIAGGTLDQPNKLMEMFRLISAALAEASESRTKKPQAPPGRGSGMQALSGPPS